MSRHILPVQSDPSEAGASVDAAMLAHCVLAWRRERSRYFDKDVFFDPAWDMLLVMQGMDPERRGMSKASLVKETDVPVSVLGRWINILVSKNMIQPIEGGALEYYIITDKASSSLHSLFGLIKSIV